jgi:tetratricopeptide (TPR) repeat protein
VGIGGVLVRVGKPVEALAAYDAALERAPSDEGALLGRADVLAATGDRVAAAATLDRLAMVLDDAGRLPEATDAARRALEFADSRSRRASVTLLTTRLGETAHGDPAAAEALRRASGLLEAHAAVAFPDVVAPGGGPGGDEVGELAAEPGPEPEPPAPPFDPVQAIAEVEDAVEAGDRDAIRSLALAASAGHRAADQPHAALDVCYMALGATPDDPSVHLALADLYLDRGWRTVAAEKLVLLARLADLTDDAETRLRLCGIATARLPDDARLAALCA